MLIQGMRFTLDKANSAKKSRSLYEVHLASLAKFPGAAIAQEVGHWELLRRSAGLFLRGAVLQRDSW